MIESSVRSGIFVEPMTQIQIRAPAGRHGEGDALYRSDGAQLAGSKRLVLQRCHSYGVGRAGGYVGAVETTTVDKVTPLNRRQVLQYRCARFPRTLHSLAAFVSGGSR
jgi:hypothetical protein